MGRGLQSGPSVVPLCRLPGILYVRSRIDPVQMSGAIDKLFLLCVLSLLSACSPGLRSRTETALDDVESYINERPDSALAVLRALDSAVIVRGPALRARAALLHSMALDKCYIDLQTDSILAPAVVWYARHGTPDEKLKTWYYLGRTQYNAGDYRAAIVTYTEALDFTRKATDDKYKGFVNQAMADTYSSTFLSAESLPYLERAYNAFLAVPDSSLARKTEYKKALALVWQSRWDESERLFQDLLLNPGGIEQILPIVKADYALELILSGDEKAGESVTLFKEALSSGRGLPSTNHWGAYAYALLKAGDREYSKELYDQLERLYPSDDRAQYWLTYEKIEHKEYRAAYDLSRRTLLYQDSLLRAELKQTTMAAQNEYLANKSLLAQRKNERKTIAWLMTTALFVLILLGGYWAYTQKTRKAEKEHARLLQSVETIRRELEDSKNERHNLARQVDENTLLRQRFKELFQEYFNTLGRICADYEEGQISQTSDADRIMLRRIDRIVNDFKGDKDGHAAFETLLNKHLDNIMCHFRIDFPNMKEPSYVLAGYIFAGIGMDTIGVLMGLNTDVLYARKYRLKALIGDSSARYKAEYMRFFK